MYLRILHTFFSSSNQKNPEGIQFESKISEANNPNELKISGAKLGEESYHNPNPELKIDEVKGFNI